MEIYLEGGGQTSLPTEGIQKSKEEGKTVLSVGAPGTLAGFASLIFFFFLFRKLNHRQSMGEFSRTTHELPELANPSLGRGLM